MPGLLGKIIRKFAEFMFKSPEDGCQTVLYCAVADGMREESGKYFENCKVTPTKDIVRDKAICKRLWLLSLHLCGLDETHPEIESQNPNTENIGNQKNEASSFTRRHMVYETNRADC